MAKVNWLKKLVDKLFFKNDPRIQRLSKLSEVITGSLHKSFFGISFKGEYNGIKFSVSFWGAEKGSVPNAFPCLEINWFASSPFTYEVYSRKDILVNMTIRLHFFKQRIALDNVYVLVRKRDFLSVQNLTSQKKDMLMAIFNRRFTQLAVNKRKINLVKLNCSLEDIKPDNIIHVLENLYTLTNKS